MGGVGGQQDGAPLSENISEMGGTKAGWEWAAGSVSPRSQPRVCLNPEMANGRLFFYNNVAQKVNGYDGATPRKGW